MTVCFGDSQTCQENNQFSYIALMHDKYQETRWGFFFNISINDKAEFYLLYRDRSAIQETHGCILNFLW